MKPRLLVASMEGYLYVYDFNKDEGGDCVLIKQHKYKRHFRKINGNLRFFVD